MPVFLTISAVLRLHVLQIKLYGGTLGVRDEGLLESALAQPQQGFAGQYLHADLYAMAAAYLFHLVQNHPFVDGNKRIGALAADFFLSLNGIDFEPEESAFEELVLSVARGESGKPAIADFFRAHCRPVSLKNHNL